MNLPATAPRPHRYYDLQSVDVDVPLPGGAGSWRCRCKVAGDGPSLLLVHGLMTDSYSFRYIIEPLAAHYRVIAPDLPGAGGSEAQPDLSMAPSHVADIIANLIQAMELESPYVVGNSLGGYYTLWLAVRHPDALRRLVVMHAPGFAELRLYALKLVLALPGSRLLFRLLTRNPMRFAAKNVHYHDPSIMSREEATQYGAIFTDAARREVFLRVLGESMDPAAMKQLHRHLRAWQQRGATPMPVSLLWACHDTLVPAAYGPRYQALIPGAELVWVDDSSHFLQVDSPERTVAEILRFDGV